MLNKALRLLITIAVGSGGMSLGLFLLPFGRGRKTVSSGRWSAFDYYFALIGYSIAPKLISRWYSWPGGLKPDCTKLRFKIL